MFAPTALAASVTLSHSFKKFPFTFIKKRDDIFVLKAEGDSMNLAKIGEERKNIEPGDFVIVDSENTSPRDGDYIVSVIDGMANIKKYLLDKKNSRIALLSESTQEYSPIFIHENDDFKINGKIVDVVKNIKQ